jgi:Flp pilus assembly protein TadD
MEVVAQEDLVGAIEDFERAIDLAPRLPEPYAGRGVVRVARGELRRAVADFERSLELAPANWRFRPSAERALDLVREELGNE